MIPDTTLPFAGLLGARRALMPKMMRADLRLASLRNARQNA